MQQSGRGFVMKQGLTHAQFMGKEIFSEPDRNTSHISVSSITSRIVHTHAMLDFAVGGYLLITKIFTALLHNTN